MLPLYDTLPPAKGARSREWQTRSSCSRSLPSTVVAAWRYIPNALAPHFRYDGVPCWRHAGALREAHEETGLTTLELGAYLGEQTFDMRPWGKQEVHRRAFFHLRCTATPPERWYNDEPHPGDRAGAGPLFELFWVPLLEGVPALIADYGHCLPALLERLGLTHR